MNQKEIFQRMSEVSPERLEAYHRMFDRILLYTLAANFIPQEHVNAIIETADKVIKRTINLDSNQRNNFLYSTKEGRRERMVNADVDGEYLRLEFLKTWDIVKEIVRANMSRPENNAKEDNP